VNENREARFLRLLNAHGAALRRLTAGYERDPGRRQDLEQEIHLAIWQALVSFAGHCAERTFVFRVAHNRAISHVRHWRLRHDDPLEEGPSIADLGDNPEQAATASERRRALAAAIRQLPLGLRQVILLLLEGLSHKEIGDVLGLTEGNVAVRATRARKALSDLMTTKEPR
jgi:RNA polymerase sigma factor (sigma-70 family)